MKRKVFVKIWLSVCAFAWIIQNPAVHGEQNANDPYDMYEKLNQEKRSLEKLMTQLQILETQGDEEKQDPAEAQTGRQDDGKSVNEIPIIIKPNENIILIKESGEYGVPVYSIDATQVKITDVLQALSASFGKSIIVDDDIDSGYLSSYTNISIQKSPLQDILEVVLGMRGLEFTQNEDSIFITSLAKLDVDTATEYYRGKSVQFYQKAQIKYPNDWRVSKAYFELGNYYYDLGFNFLALQEYKMVVGRYERSPLAKESLFRIGHCYSNLNDQESARRTYFQFIYKYPNDPLVDDALLSIGDSLMNQGLYHRAIDVYERVIREFPHEDTAPKAQFNIAKTHIRMGNYRSALQVLLQTREKYYSVEMRSEIEYQIGNCLYLLGEYQDAGNVLGYLLTCEPKAEFTEDALFLLGDCFYRENNYLAAFQIFQKAIESYPQNSKVPYAVYCMGKSLNAMNMPESAIKIFREGIQTYPKDNYAREMSLEIGKCYFDKGDYRLAYNAFESFITQYPYDQLVYEGMIRMADALFYDKKYKEAINNYLKLLKDSSDEKVRRYAFTRIGDCYQSMGQPEYAAKAFQIGLGINMDITHEDASFGTATHREISNPAN